MLLLPALLLSCGRAPPAAPTPPGWLAGVQARIAADARAIVPDGSAWRAELPRLGVTARWDADGLTLGGPDDPLRIRFSAWGRDGAAAPTSPVVPALGDCAPTPTVGGACARRLEYELPGVSAWWFGGDDGLELGWTVEAPPDGAGPLAFALDVDGADWLAPAGDGAELIDAAGRTWALSAPIAWDADGAPLPATLAVASDRIWIRVQAEGARYPVTVDPVLTAANVTLTGEAANTWFGLSAAGAGDVDGDGYDDVIVGASSYGSATGRAYLYAGSPSGVASTAAVVLTGEAAGDNFGEAVSGAGDVNGDGYDDVIVGAYNNGSGAGRVYVYLGSSTGLASTAAATVSGEASYDYFGFAAAGAGDVNGDGYDDVVIGAPARNTYTGCAYVVLGEAGGIASSAAWTFCGERSMNFLGYAVAGAGDVNGDGYDDVIVGAPGDAASAAGRALLYLGGPAGMVADGASTRTGEGRTDNFGETVAGAGDVNGDGYDDVLVGAYAAAGGNGRAYLYFGSGSGLAAMAGATLTGAAPGDELGMSVAGAGDVDADGYDDVIVGAPGASAGAGYAAVYLGSSGGAVEPAVFTMPGESSASYFGTWVSGAGDVNADGFADVVVGAWAYSGATGRAYVYHGYVATPEDGDGDGFPASSDGSAPADCDDTDASIAPYPMQYLDLDGDGYGDPATSGVATDCTAAPGYSLDSSDCDDTRADVNPAGSEVCDPLDADEDCDGRADDRDASVDGSTYARWYPDTDGDGYGNDYHPERRCNPPPGYVESRDDCDDTRADVHPGAAEVCDALDADEDCDGLADDADPSVDPSSLATGYLDADGDGYGDVTVPVTACDLPEGYVADATDCDDTRVDVNPGAAEVCDPLDVDEDCDGLADDADPAVDPSTRSPGYLDADGDGYGDVTVPVTACDLPAAYVADATDCDDTRVDVNPGAAEVCDPLDVDEDCDGLADDADPSVDPSTRSTGYLDADGDGYGDVAVPVTACDLPESYVADATDCDDTRVDVNPGAAEVCDPLDTDEDCDGLADDGDASVDAATRSTGYLDADGDGYGDVAVPVTACDLPAADVADATDCDDADPAIHPGAEDLPDNALDEDCDGVPIVSGDDAEPKDATAGCGCAGSPGGPAGAIPVLAIGLLLARRGSRRRR